MSKEPKQLELFDADKDYSVTGSDWVHIFRYMLDNGALAEMSGGALKVYVAIKILTSFKEGTITTGQSEIAEYTGLSDRQVKRAVKELKDMGYLFTERYGRKNTYQIIEQIPTAHKTGTPNAVAKIGYKRSTINGLVKKIKTEFVKELGGMQGVRDVNINIILNDGGTVNINQGSTDLHKNDDGDIEGDFEVDLMDMFKEKIGKKV